MSLDPQFAICIVHFAILNPHPAIAVRGCRRGANRRPGRAAAARDFAYLKRFPALPQLLALLRQTGSPTIIHIGGITAEFERQHASPTLRFQAHRLDLPARPRSATWRSSTARTAHGLDAPGREADSATSALAGAGAQRPRDGPPGSGRKRVSRAGRIAGGGLVVRAAIAACTAAARGFALRMRSIAPRRRAGGRWPRCWRSGRTRRGKAGKRGVGCGQAQVRAAPPSPVLEVGQGRESTVMFHFTTPYGFAENG